MTRVKALIFDTQYIYRMKQRVEVARCCYDDVDLIFSLRYHAWCMVITYI